MRESRAVHPWEEPWSCRRKIRYERPDDAEANARGMTASRGEPYHAYRCRFCGGIHIGRERWTMVPR